MDRHAAVRIAQESWKRTFMEMSAAMERGDMVALVEALGSEYARCMVSLYLTLVANPQACNKTVGTPEQFVEMMQKDLSEHMVDMIHQSNSPEGKSLLEKVKALVQELTEFSPVKDAEGNIPMPDISKMNN